MKGKIVSIAPKYNNGVHENFTFKDKIFYVFILNVDIEGQIKFGDAFSTTQVPIWKIGEEYEINIEPSEKATGGNKIKIVKENNQYSKSGKTLGRSIEERMEIISQSSYATAITYIAALPEEDRKKIFEKYGPDEAFISFANRISDDVVKNARKLANEYGS